MHQTATEIAVEYVKGPINPDVEKLNSIQELYKQVLKENGWEAEYKPLYDPSWKYEMENENFFIMDTMANLHYWWHRAGKPIYRNTILKYVIPHRANDKLQLNVPSENCKLERRCVYSKNKEYWSSVW